MHAPASPAITPALTQVQEDVLRVSVAARGRRLETGADKQENTHRRCHMRSGPLRGKKQRIMNGPLTHTPEKNVASDLRQGKICFH